MSHSIDTSDRAFEFERYRPRLFGIAYRMLGSVEDAKDIVQEGYLRFHQADAASIRSAEAWLVAVVTRLSIDRLRRASTEREVYVGEWLPEPVATDAASRTDRRAELASDLSMAFLIMLERLAPDERAAFLMHDVMDAGYDEIAGMLEKSEPACRQLVHRARARLREHRTRFPVSAENRQQLTERFLAALTSGDQAELLALVAPGATWTSDGGGKVSATRRVVHGAERITRLLLGVERKWPGLRHVLASLNGEPAVVTYAGEQVVHATSFDTDGERFTAFYRVLNPDKLKNITRDSAGAAPA